MEEYDHDLRRRHPRRDEEHRSAEARLGYWYRRRRERLEASDDRGHEEESHNDKAGDDAADRCLLYTSPSPRDYAASRMPSSA